MKHAILLALVIFVVNQSLQAQGFLHRKGKYIYDGAGNEVILRGIGTGNWMLQEGYMMQTSGVAGTMHEFRAKLSAIVGEEKTNAFYDEWLRSHFNKADVDSMKSWGFNSIRVAMHYKWFTPPVEEEPVTGQITWLTKGFVMIDSLLDWCSDNRIYLILDLHGAPGGQGKDGNISDYDPSKPSLWESQGNKDKTIALWKKLAERYANEPWIGGYDLINETNWTFPEGNNSKLRELMVSITSAIREADQNHFIIIEGNGFANDFSGLTPPWDSNMGYSFHKYWNYNTQESINFVLNLRNSFNVPVWLGESGENSNVWYTGLISLCEKNRIGWSWWPVKKAGINNPLKVTVNDDYTRLVNYWKGTAANPGADAAFNAVIGFAVNHRIENCTFMKDVVDAMIRQPLTTETIPYKLVHTGEPVFAADFNLGRNGLAYFDTDSADFHGSTGVYTDWNQGYSYRNDGVDIEKCTDTEITNGYNVGWTADGEWMEYTVVSDSAAGYRLDIRSASGSSGSIVVIEADNIAVSPLITLPGTSGWQKWQTTRVENVILPEGTLKIRFRFLKGGSNLNYFRLSDPLTADSIPFKVLTAESSADGKSVFLTLNKPVTTESGKITADDFSILCDQGRMTISGIMAEKTSNRILVISLADPLYYGGLISLSYDGQSIQSKGDFLGMFNNFPVLNRLPLRYTVPAVIQAENYAFNNGFVSESCTDSGGGLDMGYAGPGDYLDYRVYIPQSKLYKIEIRIASARSSSQLVIQSGEGTLFSDADTLNIASTGGWQVWKTLSSTAFLKEGRYTLRLYVKSGEFNTNWIQIAGVPTGTGRPENPERLNVFPNPAIGYVWIEPDGKSRKTREICFLDVHGIPVKKILVRGGQRTLVPVPELKKGIYFVTSKDENAGTLVARLAIL